MIAMSTNPEPVKPIFSAHPLFRTATRVLCVVSVATLIWAATTIDIFAQTNYIFMPYIAMFDRTNILTEPQSSDDDGLTAGICSQDSLRHHLIELIVAHPNQQRQQLECNSLLMQVAQSRAEDMVSRNYFDHITPEGNGPNYLVVQAGYRLPETYSLSPRANTIESLTAGTAITSAELTLAQLLTSANHSSHILGNAPLFLHQSEIGVGHVASPNSYYKNYWVVLIAEPGQ